MIDAVSARAAAVDSTVVFNLTRFLEQHGKQDVAVQMLAAALKTNGQDKLLQARYLTLLADVDFAEAE